MLPSAPPSSVLKSAPLHLPRIDILRAVAIWLVFNSHFVVGVYGLPGYAWQGPWYHWADSPSPFSIFFRLTIFNGSLGVSLFFLISGLCIRLSHLSTSTFSALHFYWRRFWRIYPPYLLTLVLFVSIQHNASPLDFLSHAFLVHNFSSEFFGSINGPYWSLALEFQVYLLYPALLLMHKRLGPFLTGGILCFASIACNVLGGASFSTHFHLPPAFVIFRQLPLTLWFTWYLGFLLADAIVARKAISIRWRLMLAFSICLFPLGKLFRPLGPLTTPTEGVVLALLAWEFLSRENRARFSLFGKAAATLGACSYSFYLYFDPLIHPGLGVVRSWGITSTAWLSILGYPLTFLATFALAFLAYYTVERKSISLGRYYDDKWLRPRRSEKATLPRSV